MLFLGIIWGAFHGRLAQVTEGALSAAGGSSNIKPYHGGDRSFLERDPGDRKQGRAGRAAFRENEAHIKVSVSRYANGL